jgi:hypothetical protein
MCWSSNKAEDRPLLFAAADVEIDDMWHVVGLKGRGVAIFGD